MPDPNYRYPDGVPDMRLPEREDRPKPAKPVGPAPKPTNEAEAYGVAGSLPEVTREWSKGDRVLAPWEPTYLYAGTISKLAGDQAMIKFDDGDSGWVDVAAMRPLAFKRGQKVMCRRRTGPNYYMGEIRDVDGDNVRVRLDDGSDESTTVASLRVVVETPTMGAKTAAGSVGSTAAAPIREGDRVWALWGGQALFAGTVTKLRPGEAHVRFDDGDQAWVQLQVIAPLVIDVGMFVLGRWKMGPQYFPGTITEIQGERIHIKYNDGDKEWTTPAALMMPIDAPPPMASGAPLPRLNSRGAAGARANSSAKSSPVGLIVGLFVVIILLAALCIYFATW